MSHGTRGIDRETLARQEGVGERRGGGGGGGGDAACLLLVGWLVGCLASQQPAACIPGTVLVFIGWLVG